MQRRSGTALCAAGLCAIPPVFSGRALTWKAVSAMVVRMRAGDAAAAGITRKPSRCMSPCKNCQMTVPSVYEVGII